MLGSHLDVNCSMKIELKKLGYQLLSHYPRQTKQIAEVYVQDRMLKPYVDINIKITQNNNVSI